MSEDSRVEDNQQSNLAGSSCSHWAGIVFRVSMVFSNVHWCCLQVASPGFPKLEELSLAGLEEDQTTTSRWVNRFYSNSSGTISPNPHSVHNTDWIFQINGRWWNRKAAENKYKAASVRCSWMQQVDGFWSSACASLGLGASVFEW